MIEFLFQSILRFEEAFLDFIFWLGFTDVDFSVKFIFGLLLAQVAYLFVLISFAVIRRLRRRWSRRNDSKLLIEFRSLILEYIFLKSPSERDRILANILQATTRSSMYRGFLRRLVQEQLRVVSGEEFEALTQLYGRAGFLAEDIRELRSFFWWRRLAAIIRLERLKDSQLLPIFEQMMKDPREVIALVAVRAASKLDGSPQRILEDASRLAPARRDIFVEILHSITDKDPQEVIRFTVECYDPMIAALCVQVLGERKIQEVVPLLRALLRSSDDEVAGACATALGNLNDKDSVEDLKNLLGHPNNIVRAKALRSLSVLAPENLSLQIDRLSRDPSVEVRRVLYELRFKKPEVYS